MARVELRHSRCQQTVCDVADTFVTLFSLTTSGIIFSDLFWEIWKNTGMKMPTDTSKCYIFEMLSKKNIIVVQPKKVITLYATVVSNSCFIMLLPVVKGRLSRCGHFHIALTVTLG